MVKRLIIALQLSGSESLAGRGSAQSEGVVPAALR